MISAISTESTTVADFTPTPIYAVRVSQFTFVYGTHLEPSVLRNPISVVLMDTALILVSDGHWHDLELNYTHYGL